jgi:hypothetical protein
MLPEREADFSSSFSDEFKNSQNHVSNLKCLHVYVGFNLFLLSLNKCSI